MAAVSFGLNRGQAGTQISDFVIGTAAPTASTDIELRFNTTDQNSKNLTRKDVVLACKAFIRALEPGGNTTVGITNAFGI
jgi:hypothetical protein